MKTVNELIMDDPENYVFRYHRSALRRDDVLDLERRRIFDRCWLYLGHESEVPVAGSFRRREIAGRPLFFIRGEDDRIRCFFNACTHRGARVCRQDHGTSKVFQCFYHAWTFRADGALAGVPDQEAFGPHFERSEFGLKSPRHDSYRGFHFVCFRDDVEPLDEYLAGAKDYIDLLTDQSEVGLRVVPGTNLYAARTNWKLYVENSLDAYHFAPTHVTYTQFLASHGEDRIAALRDSSARVRRLGNGHVIQGAPAPFGRPVALWHPSMGSAHRSEIEAIRRRLVERHGEERASTIAERTHVLFIFPNLIMLDIMAPVVRVIWPKAPDYSEINAWVLAPKEESREMTEVRLGNIGIFLGGGGFGTPDDIEAVEACQQGIEATEVEWSDISRGIGMLPGLTHELALRTFWRTWQNRLLGQARSDAAAEVVPGEAEPVVGLGTARA